MDLYGVGTFGPLQVKDLGCPTWGLGRSTSSDGEVVTTIGPPFLPLIVPPRQGLTLDPTWASMCKDMRTDGFQSGSFIIYDPPRVLTPEPRMAPDPALTPVPSGMDPGVTTPPGLQATATASSAMPATPPSHPETPLAKTADPPKHQGSAFYTNSDPRLPLETPASDPASRPSIEQSEHVNQGPSLSGGDPPTVPWASSSAPNDQYPGTSFSLSKTSGDSGSSQRSGDDDRPQDQGLGTIIYDALGRSDPPSDGATHDSNLPILFLPNSPEVMTAEGRVVSIDPSGLEVDGTTFSAGELAMTISNVGYTLVAQDGDASKGDSEGAITPVTVSPAPPGTTTMAGHIVEQNPSGIFVDGSRISPGDSPITLSNTLVSLDPSGALAIGSSSMTLAPQSVFAVAGKTFTANPAGFAIDGTSISPGDPPKVVDGNILSLDSFGNLVVGSSIPRSTSLATLESAVDASDKSKNSINPDPSLGLSTFPLFGNNPPNPTPVSYISSAIVIAGEAIQPDPSDLSIAGTRISAGGPPITVDGTIISLKAPGTLIVGPKTLPFATSIPATDDGGFSIQAPGSFAVVNGVTILPGSPATSIDGSAVSLETGGRTLDIGSGRLAMPTDVANGTANLQAFTGGQARAVEMSSLLSTGVWLLWVLTI